MIEKTVTEMPATPSSNFKVQETVWREYRIKSLLSNNAPAGAVYLPSMVQVDGQTLWAFKTQHLGYRGRAMLVEYGDELVIVLVTKQHLDMVIPVANVCDITWTDAGNFVGGRDIKVLIQMKEALAKELSIEPVWSVRETQMRQAELGNRPSKPVVDEAEVARKRAAEERRRALEVLRADITGRRRLHVYAAQDGTRRSGFPVVGDEWKNLTADTYCISVESFDQKTGRFGTPIESFITARDKRRGNIVRDRINPVMLKNPAEQKAARQIGDPTTKVVNIKGEPREVLVVASTEDVRRLCANGLNGGTLVMAPKANVAGHWEVFRLSNGKMISYTSLKLVHAAAAA